MFLKYFVHAGMLAEIDYGTQSATALYRRRNGELLGRRDIEYMSSIISAFLNQRPYKYGGLEVGYVYVLKSVERNYAGAYKIGHTSAHPYRRLSQVASYFNCKIEPQWIIRCACSDMALNLEQSLHYHYRELALGSEWFSLTANDLADIRTLPGGIDITNGKRPPLQYFKYFSGMKMTA